MTQNNDWTTKFFTAVLVLAINALGIVVWNLHTSISFIQQVQSEQRVRIETSAVAARLATDNLEKRLLDRIQFVQQQCTGR